MTECTDYAKDHFPIFPWLTPTWILVMRIISAPAFNFSLKWLEGRYALTAWLGPIFGPLYYLPGKPLEADSLA